MYSKANIIIEQNSKIESTKFIKSIEVDSPTSSPDSSKVSVTPKRQQWSSKLDFLMSCIGFAVGLGNVWRFPYKAYKNGGGTFLLPYVICAICGGIPMFFMEIALGQSQQLAGIGIWNIIPKFRGLGYSSAVIAFLCNCYYIMVLVWALFYFIQTISVFDEANQNLPWSDCSDLYDNYGLSENISCLATKSIDVSVNNGSCVANDFFGESFDFTSVQLYWKHRVLQVKTEYTFQYEILLCLLSLWLICYLCVYKGVKTSGKVMYFTACFPYFILISMLTRALSLSGAIDGILYLLTPDWSKLLSANVWIEAGTQVFFSYAIGLGALAAMGSYNPKSNDCFKDAVIISSINSLTSLLSGFTVFAFLGVMSCYTGVDIDKVAQKGPGLAFISYPLGASLMAT